MRGLFKNKAGLLLPNNVAKAGRQEYLRMIFNGNDGVSVAAGANMYVGLCSAVFSDVMTLADITEPTIGINGYARLPLVRDTVGWPTEGEVDGEPYIESSDLVWAASGGSFDKPVQCLFLTPEQTATVGALWALSARMENSLTITTATALVDRTFTYSVFMR